MHVKMHTNMNSPIQYGNYDAEASDNLIDRIHIRCTTMYQISDLRYNTGLLMQRGVVFQQTPLIHVCKNACKSQVSDTIRQLWFQGSVHSNVGIHQTVSDSSNVRSPIQYRYFDAEPCKKCIQMWTRNSSNCVKILSHVRSLIQYRSFGAEGCCI